MKKILSLGFILLIVCVIASGALSIVYQNTKPIIDENNKRLQAAYQKKVLPNAVKFEAMEQDKMYRGYDAEDNGIGFVIINFVKGYSGNIDIICGISLDSLITGIQVLKHTETPGLGAKITEDDFTSMFVGLGLKNLFLKGDDSDAKIDSITGATISSKAVLKGVRKAIKDIDEFKRKEFSKSLIDGVFKGNGQGDRKIIQTKVYIENGIITDIELVGRYRRDKLWLNGIELTIKKILEKQSLDINTVEFEGNEGMIESVKDALNKSKEIKSNGKL